MTTTALALSVQDARPASIRSQQARDTHVQASATCPYTVYNRGVTVLAEKSRPQNPASADFSNRPMMGTCSGQFLCQLTPTLFRPFLAHFFPFFPRFFRRSLRLARKIQETGTKTRKNGP